MHFMVFMFAHFASHGSRIAKIKPRENLLPQRNASKIPVQWRFGSVLLLCIRLLCTLRYRLQNSLSFSRDIVRDARLSPIPLVIFTFVPDSFRATFSPTLALKYVPLNASLKHFSSRLSNFRWKISIHELESQFYAWPHHVNFPRETFRMRKIFFHWRVKETLKPSTAQNCNRTTKAVGSNSFILWNKNLLDRPFSLIDKSNPSSMRDVCQSSHESPVAQW